jgi:hypothetical protein
MMLTSTSRTARDLTRLLAAWLAVIVLVQCLAAAGGLVQGMRHRHAGIEPADRSAALLFGRVVEHRHHGEWERHVHLVADRSDSSVSDGAQELGSAAGAVLSAMLGLDRARPAFCGEGVGHVMQASRAWSCITHAGLPAKRPPRA